MQVSTIGFDLAKNIFQVHGIDASEKVVVKQLRRSPGMTFFAALPKLAPWHIIWARELQKLGHEVRLMPAKDVKAYVKRNTTMPLMPRRPASLAAQLQACETLIGTLASGKWQRQLRAVEGMSDSTI